MPHSPVSMPNTANYSAEDIKASEAGPVTLGVRVALATLRAYRLVLSPWFAGCCRFEPSCSQFMAQAVVRYGVFEGVRLGICRLARCHPLGGHGYDPVPGGR